MEMGDLIVESDMAGRIIDVQKSLEKGEVVEYDD